MSSDSLSDLAWGSSFRGCLGQLLSLGAPRQFALVHHMVGHFPGLQTLGLQIAQSKSYLNTLGPEVGV